MIINKHLCEILELLQKGKRKAGSISKKLRVSQPLMSQRLKMLREMGLITNERRGNIIYFKLNEENYELISHLLSCLQLLKNNLQ